MFIHEIQIRYGAVVLKMDITFKVNQLFAEEVDGKKKKKIIVIIMIIIIIIMCFKTQTYYNVHGLRQQRTRFLNVIRKKKKKKL
jgi:hypothetical protein